MSVLDVDEMLRVTTQYAVKIVTTPLNLPKPLFLWYPFKESDDNILMAVVNILVMLVSMLPTIYFAFVNIAVSLGTDSVALIACCWNSLLDEMEEIKAKEARLLRKQEKLAKKKSELIALQGPEVVVPTMTFDERLEALTKITALGDTIPKRLRRDMIKEVWEKSSGKPLDDSVFKSKKRLREEQSDAASEGDAEAEQEAPPAQQKKTAGVESPNPVGVPAGTPPAAAALPAASVKQPPAAAGTAAATPAATSGVKKHTDTANKVKSLLGLAKPEAAKPAA